MLSPKKTRRNDDYKVRVSVRIRPSAKELVVKNTSTEISVPPNRSFRYDRCFGPKASQHDIYEQFGKDILQHSLEGYNASILAYGQTGSGKSHTMLGTSEAPGLIPQICQNLFKYVQEVQHTTAVTVRMSFLEVYNEQVRDLLTQNPVSANNSNTGGPSTPSLKVRTVASNGEDCTVEGLTEYKVSSVENVLDYLARGARTRATAATKMNDQSSRSHAVVTLQIKQQVVSSIDSNSDTREKHSVIKLVDLAGSERAGTSGATGERLKEGGNINKSLVTLGRVISTLADQATSRNVHAVVPYRDSVLTRLLQNSLGGNSRTAMIACIAPDAANQDQTLSTLRYADQAKRITNKAHVNQDLVSQETHEVRFVNMQRELNELRQQLATKNSDSNDAKLAKLVQFYEDEAAREKVRSKMLEMQKEEAERNNTVIGDYLRELSGRGMSSIDTNDTMSFEGLCDFQADLLKDITTEREALSASAQKWKNVVSAYN